MLAFEGGNRNKSYGVAGKTLYIGGACFRASRVQTQGGSPPEGKQYSSCAHCKAEHEYVELSPCDGNGESVYMLVADWIQRTGGDVQKNRQ